MDAATHNANAAARIRFIDGFPPCNTCSRRAIVSEFSAPLKPRLPRLAPEYAAGMEVLCQFPIKNFERIGNLLTQIAPPGCILLHRRLAKWGGSAMNGRALRFSAGGFVFLAGAFCSIAVAQVLPGNGTVQGSYYFRYLGVDTSNGNA